MPASHDWFQSSRVPSFAQMLKKNLPVQPSSQSVTTATVHCSASYSLSNMASKVTQVTGMTPFSLALMPTFFKTGIASKFFRVSGLNVSWIYADLLVAMSHLELWPPT